MKSFKQWASILTVNGAYAALFYLWQFKGMEGAGSALMTFLWLILPLGFLCSFLMTDEPVEKLRRPKSLDVFSTLTTLAFFGALAWAGHEVLAALYLFVAFWIVTVRKAVIAKADKEAVKQAA